MAVQLRKISIIYLVTMSEKWNLSDIFASLDDACVAGKKVLQDCKDFRKKYEGRVAALKPAYFHDCLSEYAKLKAALCRVDSYAYMVWSTHLNDKAVCAFYQNMQDVANACHKELSFLEVEIVKDLNYDQVMLPDNDDDRGKRAWLKKCLKFRPHKLSTEVEQLFAEQKAIADYWIRLYHEERTKFSIEVQGKKYNESELLQVYNLQDAALRLEAEQKRMKWYEPRQDFFALIYNALLRSRAIYQHWHHYEYPAQEANMRDDIDAGDLDNLVNTFAAADSSVRLLSHRYHALKAKMLGMDKIPYQDRMAPYPFADEGSRYTLEEAKALILRTFSEFSPEFAEIAEMYFNNDCIDFYPYEGKANIAYCMEMPVGVPSRVLLSFNGYVEDVDVLAHELGHAIHEHLSKKYGELGRHKSCAQSETASIFAEQLVFYAMLKAETDPKRRFILLAKHVENAIGIMHRQIAFHLFEDRAHKERAAGEVSAERLREIYKSEVDNYLGPSVDTTGVDLLWASILHFFDFDFYVYSYCFSFCVVNTLYEVYKSGRVNDFAAKYMKMLEKSGIENYRQALKRFGIDATSPTFWEDGTHLLQRDIEELETLAKEITG